MSKESLLLSIVNLPLADTKPKERELRAKAVQALTELIDKKDEGTLVEANSVIKRKTNKKKVTNEGESNE